MKRLTVKNKRILAAVGGTAIVLALLLFVDSINGDPISGALSRQAAVAYAERLYPDQTFTVVHSRYRPSFCYVNEVQSDQSTDTCFSVQTRLWLLTDDDIGDGTPDHVARVETRRNTCWRLEREAAEQLADLARERYGGDFAALQESQYRPFVFMLCCDAPQKTDQGASSCAQDVEAWGGALELDAPFAPSVLKTTRALLTACRVCPGGTVTAAEEKQALRELKAFVQSVGWRSDYYQVRFLCQSGEQGDLRELAVSDVVRAEEIK